MGRPAPTWFAELIHLEPDVWYTAPRLAKKFERSSANIRIVLARRIPPTYRQVRGEIFASWLGADLEALGQKYLVWRQTRLPNQPTASQAPAALAGED